MNWIKKKFKSITAEPKTVRNFGFILAGILVVLGTISIFRGHHQYKVEWPFAAIVLLINFFAFQILVYIYRVWMLVAEGISWVMLRVILGIFYYLILSPVGFFMRLSGKDLLDEKLDRSAQTYWKKRTSQPSNEQYERLF